MIKENKKQPKALYYLFGTELWERNGFYVLQSLLVLLLTGYFTLTQQQANNIYGELTALVYMLPILGGWLVDQHVGYRRCIFSGAILLLTGYFLISFVSYQLVLLGMSCIVLGNGLLKSNISSFLGKFYTENDSRREAGFTIFYIGINLGVFIATQSSGYIQRYFGWSACFWFAAAGILLAMFTFYAGYSSFKNKGEKGKIDRTGWRRYLFSPIGSILIFAVLLAISDTFLNFPKIGMGISNVFGIVALFVIITKSFSLQTRERHQLWLLLILILGSIVFWGVYFQMLSSVLFYIQALVNRNIWGINVPINAFASLEAFFLIIFGLFIAKLWQALAKRKINISYTTKFSLSFFAAAGCFYILILAIQVAPGSSPVHPIWLIASFFLLAIGELLISPIGLAMITEYSPKKWQGLMMGAWFLSLSYGGEVSSLLANIASVPAGLTDIKKIKEIYLHAFHIDVWFAVIVGIVLWITAKAFSHYFLEKKLTQ